MNKNNQVIDAIWDGTYRERFYLILTIHPKLNGTKKIGIIYVHLFNNRCARLERDWLKLSHEIIP